MIKKILCNQKGFILRGKLALLFLAVVTIATIIDLIKGNTESLGRWLTIIVVSAILTGFSYITRKN
jgi:hypothetical protein